MVRNLKKVFILVQLMSVYTATVHSQLCLPQKDCSFYRQCLESHVPCGADGYALGFGEVFCNKFVENIDRFSKMGQEWIWSTMTCLQNFLIPVSRRQPEMNCTDINTFAIASHPVCYTQSCLSVCDLPLSDWATILSIIDRDPTLPTPLWQQEVLHICSGNQ